MPKMYRYGGFHFLSLVCVGTSAASKANLHLRRHPFGGAQFSARWFSHGQDIHWRPYCHCRMAKIETQSARKAVAENHIVFGSRQLNYMPGRIGTGSSGQGSGITRAARRCGGGWAGHSPVGLRHKKTCPPGRIRLAISLAWHSQTLWRTRDNTARRCMAGRVAKYWQRPSILIPIITYPDPYGNDLT